MDAIEDYHIQLAEGGYFKFLMPRKRKSCGDENDSDKNNKLRRSVETVMSERQSEKSMIWPDGAASTDQSEWEDASRTIENEDWGDTRTNSIQDVETNEYSSAELLSLYSKVNKPPHENHATNLQEQKTLAINGSKHYYARAKAYSEVRRHRVHELGEPNMSSTISLILDQDQKNNLWILSCLVAMVLAVLLALGAYSVYSSNTALADAIAATTDILSCKCKNKVCLCTYNTTEEEEL